ncbi:hypothetical protein ACFE04_005534 [Oxalis oulophora]
MARKPHVINFKSPSLNPVIMTWDSSDQHFIIGSHHQNAIHSVSDAGVVETLISDPLLPSNTTISGLAIDSVNRRLLAVINTGKLAAYDIATRQRIFLTPLPIPNEDISSSDAAIANDVAVDFKGNAYISSSAKNLIWKVSYDGEALIFSKSRVFTNYPIAVPESDRGLNGIAYVSKGYLLVVQSNTGKIFKVDEEDGTARLILLPQDLLLAEKLVIRKDGVALVMSKQNLWFLKSDDSWGQGVVFDKTTLDDDNEGFASSVTVGDEGRAYVLYGHVMDGIVLNTNKKREWFRIEEVRSEKEGEEENIWIFILLGLGLAYFFFWRFQMKHLVSSMNKKTR